MFIRTKNISGKTYAYLVESYWTKQGTRQKVKSYLGRVRKLPDTEQVSGDTLIEVVRNFIKLLGFKPTQNFGGEVYELQLDKTIYCNLDTQNIFTGNKQACLEVNEGFFCTQTLKELLAVEKVLQDEVVEKRPQIFANTIVSTGIQISQESFVTLFQQLNLPSKKNLSK